MASNSQYQYDPQRGIIVPSVVQPAVTNTTMTNTSAIGNQPSFLGGLADRTSNFFGNMFGMYTPEFGNKIYSPADYADGTFNNGILAKDQYSQFGIDPRFDGKVWAIETKDPNGAIGYRLTTEDPNSIFTGGFDKNGNKTWAGGTGMDWAKLGLGTAMGIWGAYQQHKGLKLAQQNFEEQRALNRANFKMQAKSYNNSLRNQQSGRGYVGMSGAAKEQLGRDYNNRKAEETY